MPSANTCRAPSCPVQLVVLANSNAERKHVLTPLLANSNAELTRAEPLLGQLVV
jgi:hypothetical protein